MASQGKRVRFLQKSNSCDTKWHEQEDNADNLIAEYWLNCSQRSVHNQVVDATVLGEAHGLITDMLVDSTLPPNIVSGLKTIRNLLTPSSTTFSPVQRPRISPLVALSESGSYDSPSVEETPYIGERPMGLPKRLRRSLPPSLIRRMSTGIWTTTTSATGMPTLEPEPSRIRPTPSRHSTENLLQLNRSPRDMRSHSVSVAGGSLAVKDDRPRTQSVHSLNIFRSDNAQRSGHVSPLAHTPLGEDISEHVDTVKQTFDRLAEDIESLPRQPTSDYDSNDSPDATCSDTSESAHDVDSLHHTGALPADMLDEKRLNLPTIEDTPSDQEEEAFFLSSNASSQRSSTCTLEPLHVSTPVDIDQHPLIIDSKYIDMVDEWHFPIFDFSIEVKDQVLSQLAYKVYTEAGLFETFHVQIREFINFFRGLENGYRSNPYHNRTHAADVLHAVYFLTTQPIPGLQHVSEIQKQGNRSDSSSSCETDSDSEDNVQCKPSPRNSNDNKYGVLLGNIPPLELLALYTAAAMHDYDHPGRTNAFLVATHSPLAILYNDRSILESHHAASAWKLLTARPEFNFIKQFESAEFKRFRFLIIEAILATDLKRHFELLAEFSAKIEEDRASIDWTSESDRLLVLQMCIKLADVSGPIKPKHLHTQWTEKISEEFYQQGDEEKRLGLPVSPYMDRHIPQLAKLQETFINHIVAPLCNAYAEAGLLPGHWVEEEDQLNDETTTEEEGFKSEDCDSVKQRGEDSSSEHEQRSAKTSKRSKIRTKKMVSPLMQNVKDNHAMWLAKIEAEEREKEISQQDEVPSAEPGDKSVNLVKLEKMASICSTDSFECDDSAIESLGVNDVPQLAMDSLQVPEITETLIDNDSEIMD